MLYWQNLDQSNYDICLIHTFDDGYQNYKNKYENLWYIISTNKGKYRLKNIKSPEIIINSISSWKVRLLKSDFVLDKFN